MQQIVKCDKGDGEKWQDFYKFVKGIDSNSEPIYPNLFQLASFVHSLPSSIAFAERIFSLMASKWQTDRNQMSMSLVSAALPSFYQLWYDCRDLILSL